MSDPFGEFQQVEEKKLEATDAPNAVSNYFAKEREKLEKPESFNILAGSFRPEFRETAEKHFQQRQRFYSKIQQKQEEIEAIMERAYLVRHDKSRPEDQILHDVKGLLAELNRLEEELAILRERGTEKFCQTLELDSLGISKRVRPNSFRNPSTSGSLGRAPSDLELRRINTGSYNFSRGISTRTASQYARKSPNEKWFSFFSMFKEWRYQKELANAQKMAMSTGDIVPPNSAHAAALLQEEKSKLRAAIYTLSQRKNLSEADENLLRVLQAKLKAIIQVENQEQKLNESF